MNILCKENIYLMKVQMFSIYIYKYNILKLKKLYVFHTSEKYWKTHAIKKFIFLENYIKKIFIFSLPGIFK